MRSAWRIRRLDPAKLMTDIQRLSHFLQIEPTVIETQQWSALLPALMARAAEYEAFQSRNVILEVELEQVNLQAEKQSLATSDHVKALQTELERARSSNAEDKFAHTETTKASLLNEHQNLQKTIEALTAQVNNLTEEKRQAFVLVDRQSQAAARQEEEYKSILGRYQNLRKDSARLEASLSEAQSASSSAQVFHSQIS